MICLMTLGQFGKKVKMNSKCKKILEVPLTGIKKRERQSGQSSAVCIFAVGSDRVYEPDIIGDTGPTQANLLDR